jgi:hypothetical protein
MRFTRRLLEEIQGSEEQEPTPLGSGYRQGAGLAGGFEELEHGLGRSGGRVQDPAPHASIRS